jgi:hypothetical protein
MDLRRFSCELELTLADLFKILASLNEGFILSKYSLISVKIPALSRRILFDHSLHLKAYGLPFLAASNTLIEVSHAFFDITLKHVIFIDLCAASLDDLIRNLG